MPGCRLNDTERKLKDWWESPSTGFKFPALKGISITGEPGLRGITNLEINFNYPLTVICGQNGSGKTTLLALAALAFHTPDDIFHSYQARNEKGHYTFVDFFFKGAKDPNITGVEIMYLFRVRVAHFQSPHEVNL